MFEGRDSQNAGVAPGFWNGVMENAIESRVVLEISKSVLRSNYAKISKAVSPLGVIAVLKADAYGMGMSRMADLLSETGASAIAVAELAEAASACGHGLPVMILGTLLPSEVSEAVNLRLRLPLASFEEAQTISKCACRQGVEAVCHIALDTGMGRVGFRADDALDLGRMISASSLPGIRIEGIFSHFPMAYAPDDAALRQIELFQNAVDLLRSAGINPKWMHIANSDAINNFPAACQAPFTHVRTGINLYGSFDVVGKRSLDLKPVLTVKAKLAQVRTLPAGASIGYGRTYVCQRRMRVGTVAAGYADGLPLALSNRGSVIIRGRVCPVVGRVCMDYVMVSLDGVPDAAPGDDVLCIGESGGVSVSVEDWAMLKGTHPYEILCSIGSRVRRVLVG